eukprot:TRINITY_DN22909_c0_g1_i1.p1 TRINITY_DN22909_c0_g1~~TRINITY_DN22909_c0_g1_i1.p1  ORF type:complete len:538 (+),score=65.48 TRINITY_DN22909_c0_g1_i1:49-1662(+)
MEIGPGRLCVRHVSPLVARVSHRGDYICNSGQATFDGPELRRCPSASSFADPSSGVAREATVMTNVIKHHPRSMWQLQIPPSGSAADAAALMARVRSVSAKTETVLETAIRGGWAARTRFVPQQRTRTQDSLSDLSDRLERLEVLLDDITSIVSSPVSSFPNCTMGVSSCRPLTRASTEGTAVSMPPMWRCGSVDINTTNGYCSNGSACASVPAPAKPMARYNSYNVAAPPPSSRFSKRCTELPSQKMLGAVTPPPSAPSALAVVASASAGHFASVAPLPAPQGQSPAAMPVPAAPLGSASASGPGQGLGVGPPCVGQNLGGGSGSGHLSPPVLLPLQFSACQHSQKQPAELSPMPGLLGRSFRRSGSSPMSCQSIFTPRADTVTTPRGCAPVVASVPLFGYVPEPFSRATSAPRRAGFAVRPPMSQHLTPPHPNFNLDVQGGVGFGASTIVNGGFVGSVGRLPTPHGSVNMDTVETKLRQWLQTIPIGNGSHRGWDDSQIEEMARFARRQRLDHLDAEALYKRYVEHQVEIAARED